MSSQLDPTNEGAKTLKTNNNMFKKCKVVMLPTNEKAHYGDIILTPTYPRTLIIFQHQNCTQVAQHFYITSDEEIKVGDWIYGNAFNDELKQVLSKEDEIWFKNNKHCWNKIIATTDKSITIPGYNSFDEDDIVNCYLPQPSQQFIEKYIEEYNKGNIIIDVLVEYEQDYTNRNCSTCSLGTDGTCELNLEKKCCSSTNNATKHGDYWISCLDGEEDSEIYKIKVTPKDSTITIKKLKDSWNREEVIEQMWSAYKAANTIFEDESALRVEFNNWIDQNL